MPAEKASVTKSFHEVIFPLMKEDGFVKLSTKRYARIVDNEIDQEINIYVQSSLRREYIIQYGSILLAVPHESFDLTLGGDFKKGTSGGSYGAQNADMLEKSIDRARRAYIEEVRPALSNSITVEGYIKEYEDLLKRDISVNKSGHGDFKLACAYSLLNNTSSALYHCEQAIIKYKAIYIERSVAVWADEGIKNAQFLKESLNNNLHHTLLSTWKDATINNLCLSKLRSSKAI